MQTYSNTSHVIVYLQSSRLRFCPKIIQIHLMLLFISSQSGDALGCPYSNTSHVIVYRGGTGKGNQEPQFKYISCYCLSGTARSPPSSPSIQIHLMLLFICISSAGLFFKNQFKYISCYCLSARNGFHGLYIENSNTSHVIVYPETREKEPEAEGYSNTSHVIVYPYASGSFKVCPGIQIHLMLLFIRDGKDHEQKQSSFKYISCYCLSQRQSELCIFAVKFKYISCYCLSRRLSRGLPG